LPSDRLAGGACAHHAATFRDFALFDGARFRTGHLLVDDLFHYIDGVVDVATFVFSINWFAAVGVRNRTRALLGASARRLRVVLGGDGNLTGHRAGLAVDV